MINKKTLFCLTTGLFWFALYAYVPQMTNYAKEMGSSYKMIGLITGSYGVSQAILRIPLGIVSDVLNKRKVFIVLGLVTTVISAVLVFILPNPYTLLIGRILAGVAAATWVNYTVMFSSYYEPSESTKAIGIINSANMSGQVLAMMIGAVISLFLGIRFLFILSAIGGIIGFSLSLFIEEKRVEKKPLQISELLLVLRDKDILIICFLGILSQLIAFATTFGFTPIVAASLGANNFHLGLLTMVYTIPQAIFSALAGIVFVRYIGVKNTLILGYILNAIICVVTPFIISLPVLFIVQILNGVGRAISFPMLMGLVIKNVNPDLRTTTMGFYQAIYALGMILGPIILGSIGDSFGLIPGFLVTGLLGLLAVLTVLIGVKKEPKEV